MAFTKFQEYLDKNKKIEKPIVDPLADTAPEPTPKPPKAATKGKNWHLVGKSGAAAAIEGAQIDDTKDGADPQPYSAPGTDPGLETADGGPNKEPLGDKGDSGLIYNPKTMTQKLDVRTNKSVEKTTKEPIPPKVVKPSNKTESFLNKTRDLNPEQFAEFILKKHTGSEVNKVMEITTLVIKNKNLIETLVREIKRKGGFEELMSAVLNHSEAYVEIAKALKNESTLNKLNKILKETTAPPEIDDLDEPKKKVMPTRKTKSIEGEPMDMANSGVQTGKLRTM